MLAQRHGGGVRVSVLTQGFDDHARAPDANANANAIFDPARLELLYTGNFYRFRRPDALLEAVRALGGMRLNVATSSAPRALLQACRDAPERFRQLGFLSHADALALQRQADVLVHIANDDPVQVPGKLFEYLGAGRPVLYIGEPGCEAARILAAAQACWIVDNHAERIRTTLAEILDRKREGELPMCAPASAYGWSRIAARLEGVLAAAVHAAASGGGNVDPTRPNSA